MSEEKTLCRTPSPGKQPTRIATWKFETIRAAILACLPADGAGLPFKELPQRVIAHLPAGVRVRLGSVGWYTTTVKLELEMRGEVVRVPGNGAQRLVRTVPPAGAAAAGRS